MKIKITKRFLLSLCLMTLTLLCGENKAWAAEQIYTHTFANGNFGTNKNAKSYDAKLNNVAWRVSATPMFGFLGTGSNTYDGLLQIGSKSAPCEELKLETSAITGTIKSITLNACAAATRTVTMSVGGTSYLCGTSSSASLTTSKTDYTFSGSSSGTISISISGSSKALYLGSIKIVYEEAASAPAPTFSPKGGTYNGPQHVTITAPDGYTGGIVYTIDGSDPTGRSGIDYPDAGIDITATTTLRAVAYDNEMNFSGEATATYKIKSTDQKTNSVTFDFSKPADYGYSAPASGSYTEIGVKKTIVSDEVTITNVKDGSTKTRFWNSGGTITFRTYKGAELTISVPAGYVITSIETQGSEGVFSLGGNTAEGGVSSWEGISQTVALNNITTSATLTTMTVNYRLLSDTDDLTASLPTFPLTDQTFTLNRKVFKGWNTFCVPFALTQAQLKEAYGSGAVAKYLSKVTTDGAAATLHFTPEEGGGIEANKAYLLYLTDDVTEAKTFSGVTLEPAGTCTTTVKANNNDVYTFQGILKPTTLTTNGTQYFLNSAGTYFVLPSNSTSAMKATRAYITVPTPSGSAQGRQYSFDFNGTTTAIDNVNISGLEDGGAWYTISGIRVNRPAAKGVYIHNGRKVIVK